MYTWDVHQWHEPGVSWTKGHFGQVIYGGRLREQGGGKNSQNDT